MGALTSRQNAAVEEAEFNANHTYRFPPKTGTYFGSHFIMGGERFDTPQPESYLFGENADLNFLGTRPSPFPYPPPQVTEPTKTLNSLVNLRKESIRFVKAAHDSKYHIEFILDSDAKCAITIYYFCSEEITPNGIVYTPRDASLTSETFHYKKGINQLFSQSSHMFCPSQHTDEEFSFSEKEIPIAIHCVVEEGLAEDSRQSHTTICVVDHHADGTYALRALKQKIFVDGLYYLLQEIYGIENKNLNKTSADEDAEDTGSECVICMCDMRDTLILPCRHLCLCNSCADSLRYQANNCPICRAPFKALLQVRAVQKSSSSIVHPVTMQDNNCEGVPNGFQLVSLIEALNGPPNGPPTHTITQNAQFPASATTDSSESQQQPQQSQIIQVTSDLPDGVPDAVRAAQILNGDIDKKSSLNANKDKEFRLTTIPTDESTKLSPSMNRINSLTRRNKAIQSVTPSQVEKSMSRENIKIINEKNQQLAEATHQRQPDDDADSDTENLFPLLTKGKKDTSFYEKTALSLGGGGITDNIDDDEEELAESKGKDVGDEKEFFNDDDSKSSKKSKPTQLCSIKESATTSLPDSPISGNSTSTRSSGESYSSSSSTRQLLGSAANINTMTSIMDESDGTNIK